MNYTGCIGDPEPIESIRQFLDLITPNDTVLFQISICSLNIVCIYFEPGFRLAQTINFVEPKILD
jgi:hypothetical protein